MAEIRCLNCGEELKPADKFCHNCGQNNRSSRISVKELFKDFLGDYFTFDSKLFRSIIPLLFKPGFLTNEYISGKRVKYVPPLRMYIFISIIYFFVISLSSVRFIPKLQSSDTETTGNTRFNVSFGKKTFPASTITKAYNNGTEESLLDSAGVEKTTLNITIAKIFAKQYVKFTQNPDGFAPQVLKTASIMMFLIMPVFALLLKLLYVRRNYYYIDHLIFSFHFHSFLFLLLIILYFTIEVIPAASLTLSLLIIFYYLYRSLRNVYRQGGWKTIWKMSALLSSGFFILVFGFLVTMMVSFAIF